MRQNETKPVFPRFRQDLRDRIRGDVLKLIQVEIEVLTLAFRHIDPGESCHEQAPHDDHTKQPRIDLSDLSLGEVDQKDFPTVHDFTEIERALLLSDDRSHDIVRDECRQLRGDIGNHIGESRLATGLLRFLQPEIPHDRIRTVIELETPKILVRQDLRNLHQGRAALRMLHDQKHRVPHVLFEHRATGRLEIIQLIEYADHLIDDERLLLGMRRIELKHIDTDRTLDIRRIENDDVLGPLLRYRSQDILDGVSVRIDEAKPLAAYRILLRHLLQEIRFSGTGLTDRVQVATPIIIGDADFRLRTTIVVVSHK